MTIVEQPSQQATPERVTYRRLLADPMVAGLLYGSLLARLPAGINGLAVLLLVRQATGSIALSGAAVGAMAIGQAAITPLQGRLVDRFGPSRTLLPGSLLEALSLTALIVVAEVAGGSGALIPLAACVGVATPPVSAAVRGLWPRAAKSDQELQRLYSLDAVSQDLIWTGGPLVVAVTVALASPALTLAISAALGLIGTLCVVATPLARQVQGQRGRPRGGPLRVGGVRIVLITVLLLAGGFGGSEVAFAALAHHLKESDALVGVFLAVWSVGSALGGLGYGLIRWSTPVHLRYPLLMLLAAFMMLPLLAADSVGTAVLFIALSGVALTPVMTCLLSLIANLAPAGARTEAFTWLSSAMFIGFAAGAAAAGVLIEWGGPDAAFGFGALLAGCGAALAFALRARLATDADVGAAPPGGRAHVAVGVVEGSRPDVDEDEPPVSSQPGTTAQ